MPLPPTPRRRLMRGTLAEIRERLDTDLKSSDLEEVDEVKRTG